MASDSVVLLKPDISLQSDHLDQTSPFTLKTESAISEFIGTTTPFSGDSHRCHPLSSSMKAMRGWSITKMAVDISSSRSSPDMQELAHRTPSVHGHWNVFRYGLNEFTKFAVYGYHELHNE